MNPTLLAVLCSKVAEDSSVDESAKETARSLKMEWTSLQTAPSSDYREEQAREARREENRRKMAEFLRGLL
jgi:hypothetical protein